MSSNEILGKSNFLSGQTKADHNALVRGRNMTQSIGDDDISLLSMSSTTSLMVIEKTNSPKNILQSNNNTQKNDIKDFLSNGSKTSGIANSSMKSEGDIMASKVTEANCTAVFNDEKKRTYDSNITRNNIQQNISNSDVKALPSELEISKMHSQHVTSQELAESLQLLRYDMHREMQQIIREQVRQFAIAKVLLIYKS